MSGTELEIGYRLQLVFLRVQPSHNGCAMLEDGCNAGSSAPTSYKWVELLVASPRVLLGAIAESLAITVSRHRSRSPLTSLACINIG